MMILLRREVCSCSRDRSPTVTEGWGRTVIVSGVWRTARMVIVWNRACHRHNSSIKSVQCEHILKVWPIQHSASVWRCTAVLYEGFGHCIRCTFRAFNNYPSQWWYGSIEHKYNYWKFKKKNIEQHHKILQTLLSPSDLIWLVSLIRGDVQPGSAHYWHLRLGAFWQKPPSVQILMEEKEYVKVKC